MARDAAWKAELTKQPAHALGILRNARVELAIGALEPGVGDHPRPTVPGATNIDDVEVARLDHPVQMHVDEIQAWCRAEVAEQPRLEICAFERTLEKRGVEQVDLSDRQIVGGSPPSVHQTKVFVRGRRAGKGPIHRLLNWKFIGPASCHRATGAHALQPSNSRWSGSPKRIPPSPAAKRAGQRRRWPLRRA